MDVQDVDLLYDLGTFEPESRRRGLVKGGFCEKDDEITVLVPFLNIYTDYISRFLRAMTASLDNMWPSPLETRSLPAAKLSSKKRKKKKRPAISDDFRDLLDLRHLKIRGHFSKQ